MRSQKKNIIRLLFMFMCLLLRGLQFRMLTINQWIPQKSVISLTVLSGRENATEYFKIFPTTLTMFFVLATCYQPYHSNTDIATSISVKKRFFPKRSPFPLYGYTQIRQIMKRRLLQCIKTRLILSIYPIQMLRTHSLTHQHKDIRF